MSDQDPGARLTGAIDAVTEQVEATTDWSRQTPCADWNAHQLLDHVTDTLTGIVGMMDGRNYLECKYGEAGRTETSDEAVARWHELATRATSAADQIDASQEMTGPMGPGPATQALTIPTHDLTVHAWDLAATAGHDWEIPEALRIDLEHLVMNTPPEFLRSPGLFGPEVSPPDGANPTEQIMAFLGRSRP